MLAEVKWQGLCLVFSLAQCGAKCGEGRREPGRGCWYQDIWECEIGACSLPGSDSLPKLTEEGPQGKVSRKTEELPPPHMKGLEKDFHGSYGSTREVKIAE